MVVRHLLCVHQLGVGPCAFSIRLAKKERANVDAKELVAMQDILLALDEEDLAHAVDEGELIEIEVVDDEEEVEDEGEAGPEKG